MPTVAQNAAPATMVRRPCWSQSSMAELRFVIASTARGSSPAVAATSARSARPSWTLVTIDASAGTNVRAITRRPATTIPIAATLASAAAPVRDRPPARNRITIGDAAAATRIATSTESVTDRR